jgi:hypothetical protein
VAQTEFLRIGDATWRLDFRGDKLQRAEKAVVDGAQVTGLLEHARGKGRILWAPLPVELSESIEPSAALYSAAARVAGLEPAFTVDGADPSILILPLVFQDAVLYTFVSESGRDADLRLVHRETQTPVEVHLPAHRSAAVVLRRRDGAVLARRG